MSLMTHEAKSSSEYATCCDNSLPVNCDTNIDRRHERSRRRRRRAEAGQAAATAERGGRDGDDPGGRAAEVGAPRLEGRVAGEGGGVDRRRCEEVEGGGREAEEEVGKLN